jgi:hypothetical protein
VADLATVPAQDGGYEAEVSLSQPGLLHVRVVYPSGQTATGQTDVG